MPPERTQDELLNLAHDLHSAYDERTRTFGQLRRLDLPPEQQLQNIDDYIVAAKRFDAVRDQLINGGKK